MRYFKYIIFLTDDDSIFELKYTIGYNLFIILILILSSLFVSKLFESIAGFIVPSFGVFGIVLFIIGSLYQFINRNFLRTILKIDCKNEVLYFNNKPYLFKEIKCFYVDIETNKYGEAPEILRLFLLLNNDARIKIEKSYLFKKELIKYFQYISNQTKIKLLINED